MLLEQKTKMLSEMTTEELMEAYQDIRKKYEKVRKQRSNPLKSYHRRNAKDLVARIKAREKI